MKPSLYLAFSLLVLIIFFPSTNQGKVRRKLFTATTPPSTTTSKREEINGENKAYNKPTSRLKPASKEGSDGKQEELHDRYADIVEMDYSPARRKPPIHN
ncbi:Detected protein of unknown function [Hibiscus syriacus]|uniref:Uncharacterized protein n=1 Tax=Hibiscus syriacus TaxID=106335 RepID=A0A6A3AMR9_HIBSY|nr:Detected protein of unknown function [Hibiscus syriacus]